MNPGLVTFLPLLAAASFVLIGGERLAREEEEHRVPVDRERLLDFAGEFDAELERLDQLYTGHLDRIATNFEGDSNPAPEAAGITGILTLHRLALGRPVESVSLLPPGRQGPRLPEILIEDRGRPLDPDNAVILPETFFDVETRGTSGWLPAPDPAQRLYWTRPDSVRLVVFVIDQQGLLEIVNEHLSSWLDEPLTPLRESGELYAVHGPSRPDLAAATLESKGPAALLMPFRNGLGEWQIQAWDRVSMTTAHDNATLATSAAIAIVLALSGLLLWQQQRRALKLAEERVSFVNRVSHELGTPLTNVTLNLDLAVEAHGRQPRESLRRLGLVTEEVERLSRLVANVLTFSRRERQTLEIDLQPCSPDEVIGQALESFRPALERRDIRIDWRPDAAARTLLDPDALGQIVGNLISNVEKYAATGQWLGIATHFADEVLRVRVTDRGPGIPQRLREKVFEPFARVHREVTEGASGTGLGLTIARELAIRMGGSLVLLPTEEGSCFELCLPAPENLKVVPSDTSSAA